MKAEKMKPTLQQLIDWAYKAGTILKDGLGQEHQVLHKGLTDLVTEMDKLSEDYLLGEIRTCFPGHAVMTEESGYLDGDDGACWYIDPLDGTMNYAHGIPFFCVSIAFAEHNRVQLGVVYDPIRDECFSAEKGKGAFLNGQPLRVSNAITLIKSLLATSFPSSEGELKQAALRDYVHLTGLTQGVRRMGSAALDLVYVASGRLDGYWSNYLHAWDVAAGALIAAEAGARVTDGLGSPDFLQPICSMLAANPLLHPLIQAEINRDGKM